MGVRRLETGGTRANRIESLLSARLHLEPQLVGDQLVFVSNLAGHLSLYAMDVEGSIPQPLLPPRIALQNPELIGGYVFHVVPDLDRVVVMIDDDGDENYLPYLIPLDGGFPEPLLADVFRGRRSHLLDFDPKANVAYFDSESREEPLSFAVRVDLASGEADTIWESAYGAYPAAWSTDHSRVVLLDSYTLGDVILYEPDGEGGRRILYGTPIEERPSDAAPQPPSGVRSLHCTLAGQGLVLVSSVFEDRGTPSYLDFGRPGELEPVEVAGLRHEGAGELETLTHLEGDRYALTYNIDGCSWTYAARLDEPGRRLHVERVLTGEGELAGGMLHGLHYDEPTGRFALAFCTATLPTQLYVLPAETAPPLRKTRERPLGIRDGLLSGGEDASFDSHDGLRVPARLYLPAPELGFEGPRPLAYYVHGGPQGQERPNFAWFSAPLIQLLTLEGFAVFVPNVRGSTGYGLGYMKRVDRDWGGLDRLDHVHAMTEVLPADDRVDTGRAGVVGRSYGGYMTLMLASRHPELWRAAVDMFGPYDLLTFSSRIPETWKPYYALALGDPEHDRELLVERSPRTTIADIACPLLVIQGRNDPRVVEGESHDLVEELRCRGKEVEYLVFEDEGHDVLKLANRVRCYDAIVGYFAEHLV